MNYTSSSSLVPLIQIPILSLTIVLAVAYILLLLIRPAFRHNKLNWFTINVCLTSTCLSVYFLAINIQLVLNISNSLSIRLQFFLQYMGISQVTYSHCAVAWSRLLTVVYANKRIFQSNVCICCCVICGWILAVVLTTPFLFQDILIFYSSSLATNFWSYYYIVVTLFLPLVIVTACNTRTLLFIRSSTRRIHAMGADGQGNQNRDALLIKTMIGNFIVFLGGWSPPMIIQLFNKTNYIPPSLNIYFQAVAVITLFQSVVLLIVTNQPVRTFLKQIVVGQPQVVNANRTQIKRQTIIAHH
ncbi:unnamed protein product [Adineta ricciae]|uniref:G-protein coupled receptors family 1 profile domain-containing protein n=1 Tax=Adineta ricciae TaxID=249248 RepID=A0A814V2I9_ADIRI|nr:unnamed protein product [Adineta ricciae]CAF1282142.1 unnamed protein product [Adineta ricciae]